MTDPAAAGRVLFAEQGGSWWWLAAGPVAGATMAGMQYGAGLGWQPAVPLIFTVLVTGFLAVQVHAARLHASVEVTADILRQGTRRLPVAEIRRVHPAAEKPRRARDGGRGLGRDGGRGLGRDGGRGLGRDGGFLGRDGAHEAEPWQTAPALGELSGVPARRRGVGLYLTGGRTVQAWARDDRRLRETLRGLVEPGAASDTVHGTPA